MKRNDAVSIILFILLTASFTTLVPAQEEQAQAPAQAPAEPAKETQAPAKAEEMSIYGEVKAVNQTASSLSVQYYDYDSDEEKTAEVVLNKDTKLDGAAAIGDIKVGDWVDATYVVTDSKDVAKSITVEKEEAQDAPAAGE